MDETSQMIEWGSDDRRCRGVKKHCHNVYPVVAVRINHVTCLLSTRPVRSPDQFTGNSQVKRSLMWGLSYRWHGDMLYRPRCSSSNLMTVTLEKARDLQVKHSSDYHLLCQK